jgi:hypothetical protein
MNRQQLMRGLMIASLSVMATAAAAQAQPQGDNPRANSTPGTTPMNPQTSGGMNNSNGNNGTMGDGTMNSGSMTNNNSGSKLYNDYRAARKTCSGMPAAQQAQCTDAANKRFSAVDSKCQKLDGSALDDCLHGADHGS